MHPLNDQLWSAVNSSKPIDELIQLVIAWKAEGTSKAQAEQRLTDFLNVVSNRGTEPQEDAIRDVLDYVVGYCSPESRLF